MDTDYNHIQKVTKEYNISKWISWFVGSKRYVIIDWHIGKLSQHIHEYIENFLIYRDLLSFSNRINMASMFKDNSNY